VVLINSSGAVRFLIPILLDSDIDTFLECFETCQDPERSLRYLPVTGGDYVKARFDDDVLCLEVEQ
jgi:hypothetical protein